MTQFLSFCEQIGLTIVFQQGVFTDALTNQTVPEASRVACGDTV
jgi:hypothetical protein